MKRFALIVLTFYLSAVSAAYKGAQQDTSVDLSSEIVVDEHRGPESPRYKVLNRTAGLEKREYDNATWAVSFARSRFTPTFAAIKAGFGLAGYFAGGNSEHEPLGKTVPVVATLLRPPRPPHKNRTQDAFLGKGRRPPPGPPAIVVAGFVPRKYKGKPPKPESPHVKIQHFNESIVYVHEFSGWFVSWILGREVRHTVDALKELKICPGKGVFSVAQYDGPWKIFNRRNEIWWTERPKRPRNDTFVGFEAFDVETLFPEEFADTPVNKAPQTVPTDNFPELLKVTKEMDDTGTQEASAERFLAVT